jgi:hypothetical protein
LTTSSTRHSPSPRRSRYRRALPSVASGRARVR